MAYIQREVGTTSNELTRVPATSPKTQVQGQQPQIKKKPGLTYYAIENGVVVSKTR